MGAEKILFARIKPVANESGEEESTEAVWKMKPFRMKNYHVVATQ